MRSNGWPSDALSTNPWNAISARGDLSPDPDGRSAYGAYDAKVRCTVLDSTVLANKQYSTVI